MKRPTPGRASRFFTFRRNALRHKLAGQKLRFTRGLGYWLSGAPIRQRRDIAMFDSVDVSRIPVNAPAVAGYVNGHWPTFAQLGRSFPHAHRLSIAVTASADAECLDVEQGDATISEAAAWVKRQHARGVQRPVVYTSLSMAARLMETLARAGIPRSAYRLWTAHYSYKPHRCTRKCGYGMSGTADATQFSNHPGKNLDESRVSPTFFDGPAV